MSFKGILRWAACCGLFWMASPSQCLGQEGAAKPMTHPSTMSSDLVDRVLVLITNIELANQSLYDKTQVEIETMRVSALLRGRVAYTKVLLKNHTSMKDAADRIVVLRNQELEMIEKAASEQGSPLIQSMAILDELGRSCLLERQKLQWEAAIEEIQTEADKKRAEKNKEVAKARLKSQELAVGGLQQKLETAKEGLSQIKALNDSGTASTAELRKALEAVREIESQLRIALNNLNISEMEFELQTDPSLETGALNKLSLGERSKLLDQQLKQLAEQRKLTSQSLTVQAKLSNDNNKALEFERKTEQLQSELESYKILQEKLESALKGEFSK
jgi:chromosome segregation ATPase